jgi:hypothetical protein
MTPTSAANQDMLVIVARPDFPAICDLFVEGSEIVKKLAHADMRLLVA